jgi:hypothetical protein
MQPRKFDDAQRRSLYSVVVVNLINLKKIITISTTCRLTRYSRILLFKKRIIEGMKMTSCPESGSRCNYSENFLVYSIQFHLLEGTGQWAHNSNFA